MSEGNKRRHLTMGGMAQTQQRWRSFICEERKLSIIYCTSSNRSRQVLVVTGLYTQNDLNWDVSCHYVHLLRIHDNIHVNMWDADADLDSTCCDMISDSEIIVPTAWLLSNSSAQIFVPTTPNITTQATSKFLLPTWDQYHLISQQFQFSVFFQQPVRPREPSFIAQVCSHILTKFIALFSTNQFLIPL